MIRLRKILLCNWVFYLFIIISLLFTLIRVNCIRSSIYTSSTKFVVGRVEEIFIDGNRLDITLNGMEKIIGTYYFSNKNELNNFKENISLGCKLKIIGDVKRANSNTTENMFNYRKYLERKQIFYTVKIDQIILLDKSSSLYYDIKNYVIKRFHQNPYLYTFILGDTSYIDDDILQSYRENGISHLFSISGMHITLLSSILLKLLKKLSVNENRRYFITSLFLIFYLFLTGLSASILRGVLFFLFFSINKIYYFHIKNVNIFLLVLGISLFINPFYIYDVGFQYSFSISFSLLVLSSFIERYKSYFGKLLATSFISFIVSVPITFYNFYQVNLLSIIYNLFYVPFVSIIIFPLSIITFLIPIVEPIFNFFIYILENSSLYISRIDMFKFIFQIIPFYFYIIYYLLIILFFRGVINKKYIFSSLFIIMIIIHYLLPRFDSSSYLKMIDVGQGDSILLHIKDKNILFDTGGKMDYSKSWIEKKHKSSIVKNTTIPLLKSLGIKKIDYLVLTHGDFDHMGEASNLASNFKVNNVIFNIGDYNSLEKDLIRVLDNNSINYYKNIEELNIGGYKLYFLNTKIYDNENDNSNVIYFNYNDVKILFMGDAGVIKEKDILNKYEISDIDILKIGHHGSNTSSSEYFINNIKPKNCLISVGENNKFGHPKQSVLRILDDCNIYRTDINGTVDIRFSKNNYKIITYRSKRRSR